MIRLLRIDHRLLHGQVVFSWTKHLGISRIIVVDDAVAKNEMSKLSLKLAKPVGVTLNIFPVNDLLVRMPKVEQLKDNVMLVFRSTANVRRFCESYKGIAEINYGGIANKEGSKQYSNAVFLNEEELEDSRFLKGQGIKLYMQQVPSSARDDLNHKI